jgi:hypothetical protein
VAALMSAAGVLAQRPSALVPTTTARPKAFGLDSYNVTVIPAGSFTSDQPLYTYQGSLFRTSYDGGQMAFAGVDVPAGAIIDFIGVENFAGEGMTVTLFYVDQHSGTTLGIVAVAPSGNTYHTDYNASALGWQLTQNAHNALVLAVNFPASQELGWVEIWWKRSVSPPPATPTFGDVPSSDGGYQFIEALASSGVTGGCGGGNYCPDATLKRRQMAVFLARALGLHWPS